MTDEIVIPLAQAVSASIAGAKAHNLYLAASVGLPVPTSIVVTKRAWQLFLEEAGAVDMVDRLEGLGPKDDHVLVRELAKELRYALDSGGVPQTVKIELRRYLVSNLRGVPVAVRSSASAEDSKAASFAGQFETFLNLATPDEVENALKNCWLGAVSERVVEYRLKRGLSFCPLSMAVLIQRMVKSDSAGVLFSRNPISGDPQEIWVTSNWGLGTSVVDGSIIPDCYILERNDGRLRSSAPGRKREREDAAEHGGVERKIVEPSLELIPSLTEAELQIVWRLAMRAEDLLGGPVDVEWAMSGGAALLLQVRPITI